MYVILGFFVIVCAVALAICALLIADMPVPPGLWILLAVLFLFFLVAAR